MSMLNTRRDSRRHVTRIARIAALTAITATTLGVLGGGCDSPTQFDDFCGWIRDEENCYRDFFIDIGTKCGSTPTNRSGSFLSRGKLDLCVLTEGGQVVFDPPISLETPPPSNTEPIKVKIINPDATLCGEIEFRAQYDFSITIQPDPVPDGVEVSELGEEYIVGGKFSMTGGKSSDALSVTCAPNLSVVEGAPTSTETFLFDRLQLADCEDVQAIAPQAELEFNAGGIEINGVVRLYITYPPIEGEVDGANPLVLNYYECIIPGELPLCENGVQDGAETDIDCGGGFCADRCEDSQKCISNDDCLSDTCTLQEGLKKCVGP